MLGARRRAGGTEPSRGAPPRRPGLQGPAAGRAVDPEGPGFLFVPQCEAAPWHCCPPRGHNLSLPPVPWSCSGSLSKNCLASPSWGKRQIKCGICTLQPSLPCCGERHAAEHAAVGQQGAVQGALCPWCCQEREKGQYCSWENSPVAASFVGSRFGATSRCPHAGWVEEVTPMPLTAILAAGLHPLVFACLEQIVSREAEGCLLPAKWGFALLFSQTLCVLCLQQ